MTLYFAYGSNLNKAQMNKRCPRAKAIGTFILNDARLVFRGVADVIADEKSTCIGGIWKITSECEHALDIYEGIDAGMYRKVYLELASPIAGENELMIYVMNSTGIYPPSRGYYDCIREGYRDFKIDRRQLDAAVAHSHDEKAPSHIERQRRRRTGNPELAKHPKEARGAEMISAKPKQTKRKLMTANDYRKAMIVYGD